MTEKEKMLHGLLYNPDSVHSAELSEERCRAKNLCYDFNLTRPSDTNAQMNILRQLIGTIRGECCIVAPFWCDYGYNITLGAHFFANHNLVILDCAPVTFGDYVLVAPDCGFHTAGHPIDYPRRDAGLEYAYPITVGSHVWFGAGVQVMPGVTIGSDVVIGGGSVVVHDIPDHVVAVGNPCRVLRPITERDRETNFDRNFRE